MLRLEPTNLLLVDGDRQDAVTSQFNTIFMNEKLTIWVARQKVPYNGKLLETFQTFTDAEEFITGDSEKVEKFSIPKVQREFGKYLIVGDEELEPDNRKRLPKIISGLKGTPSKEIELGKQKHTKSWFATNVCIYDLPDTIDVGYCFIPSLGFDIATLKVERINTPELVLGRYENALKVSHNLGNKKAALKLENVAIIREQIQRQSSHLHKWSVVYTFFGKTTKELDDRVKSFKKQMERLRVNVDQPKFVQKTMYENRRAANGEHIMISDTHTLKTFYPFVSMELIEYGTNAVYLGTNVNTGSPVIYNSDSRQLNRHIAVVGTTGGGKTTTVNVMVYRLFNKLKTNNVKQPAIVIVDPKEQKDYFKLSQAVGIPYKLLSEGIGIDPVVHYSTAVASGILRNLFKLDKPQEDILLRVIERLQTDKKTIFDLEKATELLVKDGHEDEQVMEEYKKLHNAVHSGMVKHSYIFKGEYPSGSFAVNTYSYDTDAVKAASTIVMLQTKKYFSSLDIATPKFLIVDEGWMLIEDKYAAETLELISRVSRANNVSLIFITQDPKDVLKNKIGSTILNNCDTKILMPTDSSAEIKEALSLSNIEEGLLKTTLIRTEPGMALIIANHKHIRCKIQVKDEEMALFSTKSIIAS